MGHSPLPDSWLLVARIVLLLSQGGWGTAVEEFLPGTWKRGVILTGVRLDLLRNQILFPYNFFIFYVSLFPS